MASFVTQIKLLFIVFGGSFDPQTLTKAISVTPTNVWKKGDKIKSNIFLRRDNKPLPVRSESGWEHSFGFLETLDFQDVSKLFIDVFAPKAELLKSFIEENNLEVTVNVVAEIADGQTPSLHLNKELISFIYYIGAEIDIDTYLFEND